MSLGEIEAELEHLTLDELRRLALKSYNTFLQKEGRADASMCEEDNPALLDALDEAVAKADELPGTGRSADEVRAALRQWTSR